MADAIRETTGPVDLSRRLEEAPWEFDLFEAMRLIECSFPDKPRIGEAKRPNDEPVRFAQEVSLAFAPSALAAFEPGQGVRPTRLVQRVFGLFGPNGALPIHLTEWARDRLHHHNDPAFIHFLDVFHHRLLSLFYRAWAQAQPAVSMDRPDNDRFGRNIAALCGLGAPGLRNRDSVPDFAKLAHAGVFGRQVRNAECLQIVLANYFNVPVQIEEFVGHWLQIPLSQHSRLGHEDGFVVLGQDAMVGGKTWNCQSRFRVIIGPVNFNDYERFLPRGASSGPLHDLIKLYVGMEQSWEINLVLKNKEVPLGWLGNSLWIGWSSWLGVRFKDHDAADYCNQDSGKKSYWIGDLERQAHIAVNG